MPRGRGGPGRSGQQPTSRPEPPDPEDRQAAEAAALRILQGASQSEAGMRRRLRRRGFSEETAIEVTGHLVGGGWINDRQMAVGIAERRRDQGYGRRRVAADLAARGITDETTIGEALEAIDPDAEFDAARRAARRLRGRFSAGPLEEPDLRRLAAALQRRGFSAGAVRGALREIDAADRLSVEEDG